MPFVSKVAVESNSLSVLWGTESLKPGRGTKDIWQKQWVSAAWMENDKRAFFYFGLGHKFFNIWFITNCFPQVSSHDACRWALSKRLSHLQPLDVRIVQVFEDAARFQTETEALAQF